VPNRRRRRLSTATSAVAALAVVTPFAVSALSDMTNPAPQPREFRQAAMTTDLPNELMSALSQGLSQFGINLPSMPGGLTGSGAGMPTTLTAPGSLAPTGLPGAAPAATPGLTSPLTPGLATPPGVNPAAAPAGMPPLNDPALSNTALLTPGAPGTPAGLTPDPAATATNPALNPNLTSPLGTAPGGGGLTTPQVPGANPALATTPISNAANLPNPGEVPISAPIGLDPGTGGGMLPMLGGGDTLGSTLPAANTGGGGLLGLGDLSNVAQQLGATQAIDLLKGVVMPMITSAMKPAAALPAAPPAPVPPPPT
jgi:hypothetical protein